MKYSVATYARALVESVASSKDDAGIVKRFMALLVRNGDEAVASKIVSVASAQLAKKNGGRSVVIESARPLHSAQRAHIMKSFSSNDIVEEKINPSLRAGVRIMIDGEQLIDASLSHKLQKLFNT